MQLAGSDIRSRLRQRTRWRGLWQSMDGHRVGIVFDRNALDCGDCPKEHWPCMDQCSGSAAGVADSGHGVGRLSAGNPVPLVVSHNQSTRPRSTPAEEEVLIMADLAAQRGTILPDELRWVDYVLLLNNVTVQQLMTPRHVVFSLPAERQLDSSPLLSEKLVHSRIPVTEGDDLDRVVGVVQRRTIFDHIVRDDCHVTLRELMRPALFVSEDSGGHQLLDRLMAERQHLPVVTNSSGHVVGVATLEDVLEYLVCLCSLRFHRHK